MAGKKASKKIDDWKDLIKYWKDWEFTTNSGEYYNLRSNEFDSLLEKSFSKWAWKEYKDTIPTPRDLIDRIIQILKKDVELNLALTDNDKVNDLLQPALDPFSWTGGILLRLCKNRIKNIAWLEVKDVITEIANENLYKNCSKKSIVENKDFLTWVKNKKKKYNLIFTNPPSDFFDTNADLSIFDKILVESWYLVIFSSSLEKLESVKNKIFEKYNLKYLIRLPSWTIWALQQNVLIFQKNPYEGKTILLDLKKEDKKTYLKYIDKLIEKFDIIKKELENIEKLEKPIFTETSNTFFVNYNQTSLNFSYQPSWELEDFVNLSFDISKKIFVWFKDLKNILANENLQIDIFDCENSLEEIEYNKKGSNKISVQELYYKLQEKYIIPRKTFIEFVTSLQVNNFLILSGPSWVGKTMIVDEITEIINSMQAESLILENKKIPVKSNWFDDSETLGYWNSLLGTYEIWKMLKFLTQAWANPCIPYFMLLDEMNLSNIEFYFTNFISNFDKLKTEGKFEIPLFEEIIYKDEKNKFDKLQKFLKTIFAWIYSGYENFVEITSLDENQKIDSRTLKDMLFFSDFNINYDIRVKFKIPVFPNLHIIWTINEDETVYPLSNRVLDRASYILFDVDLDNPDEKNIKFKDFDLNLTFDKYKKYKKIESLADIEEKLRNKVQSLNKKLEGELSNLKIAYRSIEYMQNFINVIKKIDDITDEKIYEILFEQKIRPRLKSSLNFDNEGLVELLKSEFVKK